MTAAEDPEHYSYTVYADPRMAEIRQRANPMIFTERGPPRLEERLGGEHEDVHGEDWSRPMSGVQGPGSALAVPCPASKVRSAFRSSDVRSPTSGP
jgi:hypothetical protein